MPAGFALIQEGRVADHHLNIGLAEFQRLAANWPSWKREFSVHRPVDHSSSGGKPIVAAQWAALTRTRPVWELAVASAAYTDLAKPQFLFAAEKPELLRIAGALETRVGRTKLANFAGFAQQVSSLTFPTLIRAVPRFTSVIRAAGLDISVENFRCAAFCNDRHPEGGPALIECLKNC